MTRCTHEALAGGDLEQGTALHHADAVAHITYDRQIVRDEHVGQLELASQIAEQIQKLRLNRHVERRGRFVKHDEAWLQGERPGKTKMVGAKPPSTTW